MEVLRGQRSTFSYVIEVTKFNSEDICDLWGCLEAAMVLEASKIVVKDNMHIDSRVSEVTDFKSEVNSDLWGYWGCLEATIASEATRMAVIDNMHIDTRVI